MPDFTNGGQTSLSKTANAITGGVTKDDKEQAVRNKEAQVNSPNSTSLIPMQDKQVFGKQGIGVVPVLEKDLSSFYGIRDLYKKKSTPYFDDKGFYGFVQNKQKLNFATRANIESEKNLINFNVKRENSSVGIDVNFAVTKHQLQQVVDNLQSLGRFDTLLEKHGDKVDEFFQNYQQVTALKMQGYEDNSPEYQEAISELKIQLNDILLIDQAELYRTGESRKFKQMLEMYDQYNQGVNKLHYVRSMEGSALRGDYDDMLKVDNNYITERIYLELDSRKDEKFQQTGSRMAKQKLLSNPLWQREVTSMVEVNPALRMFFERESSKNYISDFERDVMKKISDTIGPIIRQAYQDTEKILGRDEARRQFGSSLEIVDIYSNLSHRGVIDDLIEEAYHPISSFELMTDLVDKESLWEQYAEKKFLLSQKKKKISDIVTEKVWGDVGEFDKEFDPEEDYQQRLSEALIKKSNQAKVYKQVWQGQTSSRGKATAKRRVFKGIHI